MSNYFFNPFAFPYFLVGVAAISLGIGIFLQNKKSQLNLSYMIMSIAAGIWLTGDSLGYFSHNYRLALMWGRYYCWLGIIFIAPAVYMFSVIWEDGSLKKKGRPVYGNFLVAFFVYAVCIFTPYVVKGMWLYSWGYYPKAGLLAFPFIIWFYILMVLSLRNFILSYRREIILVRKKQAKLFIIAFIIAFFGSIEFLPNYGLPLYLCAFIPIFAFVSLVGYSVIHYKLMDIETVFHKTVVWFLSNLILMTPFVLIIYFTRHWWINLDSVNTLSFLGAIFLSFLAFYRLLQPKVDNFFQRRRYNFEDVERNFTEDLVHLKGFSNLVERIENTLVNTVYPRNVEIFIYDRDKERFKLANTKRNIRNVEDIKKDNPFLDWLVRNNGIVYKEFIDIDPKYSEIKEDVKDYFNITFASVVIPLILNGRLLGLINLGKKANLKRYNAVDFHFLAVLKNQSVIAVSNTLLYEHMEEEVRQRTKELVGVQKQLIQTEKLATIGTLAGGVAHEINNPLTAILTNIQMLLASGNTPDKESLELIEEATQRCRNIVKKLMAYARKPKKDVSFEEVNVSALVNDVVSFLRYQLEQENIKINIDIPGDGFNVLGNRNELEQVLTNLILNGRDAVRKNNKSGIITVVLDKMGGRLRIKIRDNGCGISQDVIPKIFDPFFTTKDVGKGLGLGLSICHAIVEKHKGSISVKSELGRGSKFVIALPAKG